MKRVAKLLPALYCSTRSGATGQRKSRLAWLAGGTVRLRRSRDRKINDFSGPRLRARGPRSEAERRAPMALEWRAYTLLCNVRTKSSDGDL